MKKLVSVREIEVEGLKALLGQKVLLMCTNYFYSGKLTGVNSACVELTDPAIVYETGDWSTKTYATEQKLPFKTWYVQTFAIESFGEGK